MKKFISFFICFSLFLSIPFSLSAKEGIDVSDDPIPVNENDDISLNSAGVGDTVYYQLLRDGNIIIAGNYTIGNTFGWSQTGIDQIRLRFPVDYTFSGSRVNTSLNLDFNDIRYQSAFAQFGNSSAPVGKQAYFNGANVGTTSIFSISSVVENNTSINQPFIWVVINFYYTSGSDMQFTLNNVSFVNMASETDYTDILNTINTNVIALQGGLNNIYNRLSDISNNLSSVLQSVNSIETLTNTISSNLSFFRTEVIAEINNLRSQLIGHFRDLTALLINQFNSWSSMWNDFVDLFTSGNTGSQETVENSNQTNDNLENVTNEHDKIEQDATNDFNSAIADVDISQGTDFLTSMSASFTWVGTQMNQLFNLGGQIQY